MPDDDNQTVPEPVAPTEALDPAPTPAPAPQPQPARRRGGAMALLLGGVLAAGAGFGVAQYVPQGWPIGDTSALEARLAAQETEIAGLKAALAALPAPDATLSQRIDTLSEALATLPPPADTAALEGRIAALESMPTGNGNGPSLADFAAQAEALRALQAEVTNLRAAGGTMPANVEALVADAEARLKEAEAQAATLKTEAEAIAKASAARAALGRIQAALESGGPFAAALPDLGAEVPQVLTDAAEIGVPSLTALQTAFPDAARAALEAALRANMGESWAERVGSFLRSQTGVRSLTPREGGDPDAILSRAEAALATGDLQTALTELDALPPEAAAQMQAWRDLAGQRQAALSAVADLAKIIGQ